jgi:SAM-dependent methyltransferase
MERIRRIRHLSGAAVLDYGCGSGRWADFLRAYGCLYTGVDLSAGMLKIAQRQHPDIEFRKTNGLVVPHGNKIFDLVWSVAVVHHNPPDRQEKLLAEFVRVLHDGGFLVLLEGVGSGGRPPARLYYPRTRSAWSALAQRHGLSLRWRCGASYFALRWLVEVLWWRIEAGGGALAAREGAGGGFTNSPRKAAWLRFAARVDAVLCPQLVGCLPPPLQRRVIMVFQKRSARELAMSWVRESSVPSAVALSSRLGSHLGPGNEPARVAPECSPTI